MSEAKEMSQCHALAVILKSGSATNYVVNMVCEKLEENDKLKSRVSELELSLDDRDCYIADADMKNEELKLKLDAIEELVVDARKYGVGAKSWLSFRNKIDSILKDSE